MSTREPSGLRIGPQPPERQSPWAYVVIAAVVGVAGFLLIDEEAPPEVTAPTAGLATSTTGSVLDPKTPLVPRCREHGPTMGYAIGERATAEQPDGDDPPAAGSGDPPDPEDAPSEPPLLPFSVAIGRGAAMNDGSFVVGVKRDRDGGSWAEVAVVDGRAASGRLVELSRSRGDVDAPLVVRCGDGWVAALLEPNAGGLDLRLVSPDGKGGLTWGATLPQGRDESLALDVVFGVERGLVAWDEVVDDGERAVVEVATIDATTLAAAGKTEVRSREGVDAELPRLLPRGDGFWLFYVARQPVDEAGERTEGRFAAERIVPSWLEVVPLDASGVPAGAPISVTGQGDHVLAYDVKPAADDGAVVIWRDDDTPSGAHGGDVFTVVVGASGPGAVQPVTAEKVGAGVPDLIGGFVALHNAHGQLQLAPADGAGVLTGPLQVEPRLGGGQLVAAHDDVLLVARPSGRAVELFTAACDPRLNTLPDE